MSYGLLWFSHLAFCLLLIAGVTALASRCRKPAWRKFWPILAAILNLLTVGGVAAFGVFLSVYNLQPEWLSWYGLSLTITYIVATFYILRKGLKDAAGETQAARSWPRGKLFLGVAGFFLIDSVCLHFMELRTMVHLANVRIEATGNLLNLLPARIPDAFNALVDYEAAIARLGPREKLPDWLHTCDQPGFDPSSDEAEGFLSEHQPTLALIHTAVSKPGYSLKMDTGHFYDWPLPNLVGHLNLARLLSLAAKSRAVRGDTEAAFQHLAEMDEMGGHLRSYPLLTTVVVASSLDGIRARTLEYVLAQHQGPLPTLIRQPIMAGASVFESFRRALRVEAQGHLQGFAVMAASSNIHATVRSFQPTHQRVTPATKMWRVFLLPSDLRAAKDLIAAPMSRPVETYEELRKHLDGIQKAYRSGEMGLFTAIAAPDYSRYLEKAKQQDARRGLCDLALAVTRFKVQKKVYPSSLQELVPEFIDRVPLDPYDRQPLKCKAVSGGLDLYSIGPDSGETKGEDPTLHFYLGREAYETHRVKPVAKPKP